MGKVWKVPPPAPKLQPVQPQVDFISGGSTGEVVRCIGADALIANIMQLPRIAIDAAGREMAIMLDEVKRDSQDNFVPVDTGNLQLSADSDTYIPGSATSIAELRVWYAAEITADQAVHGINDDPRKYAWEQHEDMELNHPHGGGPKYLEIPFTNKIPEMLPRIAAAIGQALGVNGAFVSLAINEGSIRSVDPTSKGGL